GHRSLARPVMMLLCSLSVLPGLVLATSVDLSPTPAPAGAGPEPNAHHSYVKGVCPNGIGLCIVATDAQYAADIRNNFTGQAVDILMQQCYGGGFKKTIQNLQMFTFASATTWGKCAYNGEVITGGALSFLETFTRPWRKDA